jgi:hypothetical protein
LYRSTSRGRIVGSGRIRSHLAAGIGRLRKKFRMMVEKPPRRPMIRAQEGNFKMMLRAMDCGE